MDVFGFARLDSAAGGLAYRNAIERICNGAVACEAPSREVLVVSC
jgi:hypothetical protein